MSGDKPRYDRRSFLRTAGVASAVGGASMLAGCGSSGDGGSDGGSTPTEEPTPVDQTATTAEPSSIETGGTLTIALASDANTLNPHQGDDTGSGNLAQAYASTLVDTKRNGEVVGDLAKNMSVKDDGLTYVFELHEGIQFHGDYGEVTAEKVRQNYLKIIDDDEYAAPGRSEYDGILRGKDPDGNEISAEDRITATGEYTIEFELAQPDVTFPYKMTSYRQAVLPVEAIEGMNNFGTAKAGTVGTGPFEYKPSESNDASHYVFEANDDYFKETEAGQLPYLNKVRYEVVPDGQVRNTKLTTGEADVNATAPANKVESIRQNDDIQVKTVPSVEKISMWVNQRNHPPFPKKKVRKALAYASNQEALVNLKFNKLAQRADSLFPPWHWAFDEEACTTYEHDPDRAKSLLEEAGETDLSFSCTVTNQPKFVDTATILQQNFKSIGVDMSVNPKEKSAVWGPWLPGKWDADPVGAPPDTEALVESIGHGYSADGYAYLGFHTGAVFNSAFYSDDEVDQWLEEARRSRDREKRKELYSKVQAKVTDDIPQIFQVWPNTNQATRKRVKDYTAYPDRTPRVESVWLEQ